MHKKNKWQRVAVTTRCRIHRLNYEEHTMNADDNTSAKALRATQKILVVEDNALNQKVIIKMLENLGYPHDIADCAHEALKMLTINDYACILLDIGLPDINGVELLPHIKKQYSMPVITCTAYGDESRPECIAAGASEHIGKPVMQDKLESILVKILEGTNANTDEKGK